MIDLRILRNKYVRTILPFNNVFSPEECQMIINCPDTSKKEDAYILDGVDKSIRNTKIKFINQTPNTIWIGERLHKFVWEANRQFYNFNISFLADIELLEYTEGSFFNWHSDIFAADDTEARKISIIVFLSDPKDYEGGQIRFNLFIGDDKKTNSYPQGSMIIFPSFHQHKVEPVTSGVRYTLVAWAYGDPFY